MIRNTNATFDGTNNLIENSMKPPIGGPGIVFASNPHIITTPSVAAPAAPSGVPTQMIGPIISKLLVNPVGIAFAGGLIGLHKIIKRRQELMK